MIVLLRELLSGFAEHGAARAALGVEASRRVGILGQLARNARPALAPRLDRRRPGVGLSDRAEGGSEELSGVFGGPPRLASNSAMRAFNAFACASNSSMRLSQAAICTPSARRSAPAAGFATSWAPRTARQINLSLRHGERESSSPHSAQLLRPESQRPQRGEW